MEQLKIDCNEGSPVHKLFSLINSQNFADDNRKAIDGNKSAKKRMRKHLLIIRKLAQEGRKKF